MHSLVFHAVLYILGVDNISSNIAAFAAKMLDICKETIEDIVASNIYIYLVAVGTAIVVIYFMVDLLAQSNREMLTMESLILGFTKLFVAAAFIMFVSDLTTLVCEGGSAIFSDVAQKIEAEQTEGESTTGSAIYTVKLNIGLKTGLFGDKTYYEYTFTPGNTYNTSISSDGKTMLDILKDGNVYGNGIIDYICHLGVFVVTLIISILKLVIYLVCYYVVLTTSFQFVLYGLMMPIGIAHLLNDGEKSQGVMYCKKFFSKALAFTLILICLYIFQKLQMSLIYNMYGTTTPLVGTYNGAISYVGDASAGTLTVNINAANLDVIGEIKLKELFGAKIVAYAFTPGVALVTALMGIGHLSEDLVG